MEEKICTACLKSHPIEYFTFKNKAKGKRHSQCKDCTRQLIRTHYQNNKPVYLAKAHKRTTQVRQETTRLLLAYLAEHPCVDCGLKDMRCLEFDHVRGEKKLDVSVMLSRGYGWDATQQEIDKCEVCCANCHRIRTIERAGHRKALLIMQDD